MERARRPGIMDDWMTVREYADARTRNRTREYLIKVGRRAAKLTREKGLDPGVRTGTPKSNSKIHLRAAASYKVGTYPQEILEQAFREIRP
jgi:hypothetical protein